MSLRLAVESSPLMPNRPRCPRCGRKRWLTVVIDGKQRDCKCSCGHEWREK